MSKSLNERIVEIALRKSGKYLSEEGILYCRRCNSALQRRVIDSNGITQLIDIPCLCPEIRDQQRKEKSRREAFISPILSTYRYNSLQNKDEKENPYLAKFIRKFGKIKEKAIGVYIYSLSDKSRTFNLARVANGVIDRGYTVKYVTTSLFSTLRNIHNADYSELLKKLVSFDAIAFADLDLMSLDEKELSFLYSVMSFLVSSGVILLISGDEHINNIRPDTYYGKKIKTIIEKKCVVIPLVEQIKEINPQEVARDELWLLENEDIINEK